MQKLLGIVIVFVCVALHAQTTTNSFEISARQRSYWNSNPHIPKLEDARGQVIATNAQLRGVLGRRATFKLNDQMKSFDVEELSAASLALIDITLEQAV